MAVASLARGALLDYGGDGLGAVSPGGDVRPRRRPGEAAWTPGGTRTRSTPVSIPRLARLSCQLLSLHPARRLDDRNDPVRTSGVLSDYAEANRCADDGREMDLASRAAFCEVALLASVSHGIHAAFLALGEEVPPLPTPEEMGRAPGPMNLRYSSLLRRVRRDDAVAAAPFFLGRDIDRSSPE
ncbi:hypothetical protein THAOC_19199, partial [Thalassiosira oceanica]